MDFQHPKQKNMGMPARHISSQSFDEILSDLGDDPAIPDPHGIRKPPPHQSTPPRATNQGKSNPFTESLSPVQIKNSLQGIALPIALIGILMVVTIAFFVAYTSLNKQSQDALEASQQQLSELKKEILLTRDQINQDQDELYLAIDEIEVSIHSLKERKPEIRSPNRPQAPTHESELRRWRYLGTSQMGNTQQAYFHTGKSHLAFEKGAQVLGEWRLSSIEKGLVTLTHSQGKSLLLKASKSE
ncbi:superinfection exclusion B family protein [Polynucleobacter sp. P1-05-14]|uniref:superinfection exclusion B family protein n=1 Tax=Polynucleobacter sp. P1-05-14 TaxID=1819732 RepID=UPI001C0C1148|nr:superinfection exclusion B family protein [Polynucleobacter sp. P1-05-14]MBU3547614.1 superinfection exclusion B family protein [Polynucleobacter sp. P1-05-14]